MWQRPSFNNQYSNYTPPPSYQPPPPPFHYNAAPLPPPPPPPPESNTTTTYSLPNSYQVSAYETNPMQVKSTAQLIGEKYLKESHQSRVVYEQPNEYDYDTTAYQQYDNDYYQEENAYYNKGENAENAEQYVDYEYPESEAVPQAPSLYAEALQNNQIESEISSNISHTEIEPTPPVEPEPVVTTADPSIITADVEEYQPKPKDEFLGEEGISYYEPSQKSSTKSKLNLQLVDYGNPTSTPRIEIGLVPPSSSVTQPQPEKIPCPPEQVKLADLPDLSKPPPQINFVGKAVPIMIFEPKEPVEPVIKVTTISKPAKEQPPSTSYKRPHPQVDRNPSPPQTTSSSKIPHYSSASRDLEIVLPLKFPAKKPVASPKNIIIPVESLLFGEPRTCRPCRILVIIRGLPGSGKSSLAQLIKTKETEMNRLEGVQPTCRVLSLDDYFIVESESQPGKLVYEYDPQLEANFMKQLLKTVGIQMDNAHFPFLIIEAPFHRDFDLAFLNKQCADKDYQPFLIELETSLHECIRRSKGRRSKEDIEKMARMWEAVKEDFVRLECTQLEQELSARDVEMDLNDTEAAVPKKKSCPDKRTLNVDDPWRFSLSKWDLEDMEMNKERLDGLSSRPKHHDISVDINECIFSGSGFGHSSRPNRKGRHVTWGDVELLKKSSRQREMGFVVGQTDWHHMVDPSAHEKLLKRGKLESKSSQYRPNDYTIKKAKEALVRVKYI